jgi:isoleucyl-tRNA synthetase
MHKSTGNAIEASEAIEQMGADVMRWMYSEQAPSQNLNFGYGPAHEIKRRLLTFWNCAKFFVDYANVSQEADAGDLEPLDRWLLARVEQLVAEATDAYERYWTPDVVGSFEAFVDDLSNWYIRRSRRRFWDGDAAALATLRTALMRSLVVIAPVMPFLSDHLWRALRADDQPESVFLARWQDAGERDQELLDDVADTRRVVELGHQARGDAGIKLRQPLRRAYIRGADGAAAHAGELGEELNVKEIVFDDGPVVRSQLKPNLPVLGPRLGSRLPAVKAALELGDYEELEGGGVRVAGEELGPDDVLHGESSAVQGFAIAQNGALSIAIDTALDDELVHEGRVRELVHRINALRRDAGLELTDRIAVTLGPEEADLVDHEGWIKDETLALSLEVGDALAVELSETG